MDTAFTYTPPSNNGLLFYPGVPMGDLSQDTYDALPDWVQAAVSAATIYVEVEE